MSFLLTTSAAAFAGEVLRTGAMLNAYDTSVVEFAVGFQSEEALVPERLSGATFEWRALRPSRVVLEGRVSEYNPVPGDLPGLGSSAIGLGYSGTSGAARELGEFTWILAGGFGWRQSWTFAFEPRGVYGTLGGAFLLDSHRNPGDDFAMFVLVSGELGIGSVPWALEPLVIDFGLRSAPFYWRRTQGAPRALGRMGVNLVAIPLGGDSELMVAIYADLIPLWSRS